VSSAAVSGRTAAAMLCLTLLLPISASARTRSGPESLWQAYPLKPARSTTALKRTARGNARSASAAVILSGDDDGGFPVGPVVIFVALAGAAVAYGAGRRWMRGNPALIDWPRGAHWPPTRLRLLDEGKRRSALSGGAKPLLLGPAMAKPPPEPSPPKRAPATWSPREAPTAGPTLAEPPPAEHDATKAAPAEPQSAAEPVATEPPPAEPLQVEASRPEPAHTPSAKAAPATTTRRRTARTPRPKAKTAPAKTAKAKTAPAKTARAKTAPAKTAKSKTAPASTANETTPPAKPTVAKPKPATKATAESAPKSAAAPPPRAAPAPFKAGPPTPSPPDVPTSDPPSRHSPDPRWNQITERPDAPQWPSKPQWAPANTGKDAVAEDAPANDAAAASTAEAAPASPSPAPPSPSEDVTPSRSAVDLATSAAPAIEQSRGGRWSRTAERTEVAKANRVKETAPPPKTPDAKSEAAKDVAVERATEVAPAPPPPAPASRREPSPASPPPAEIPADATPPVDRFRHGRRDATAESTEAAAWPPETQSLWRCEIVWAGGLASRFEAVAIAPGRRGRHRIAATGRLRRGVSRYADPARAGDRDAFAALVAELRAAGWRPIARGDGWHTNRFVWSGSQPSPSFQGERIGRTPKGER
jgi:hypothetical protein